MNTSNAAHTLSRRLCTLMLATVTATAVVGLSIPTEAWAAEPSRGVTGFQAVALDGSMTVRVELAEQESVRVSSPGASADLVETVIEQRRGLPTLVVRNSRPWPSKKLDVVVTVQGPQFKALSVAGSGDVRYTGPASNVTTVVTGSGTVRRD